jgi:hypothetical protein
MILAVKALMALILAAARKPAAADLSGGWSGGRGMEGTRGLGLARGTGRNI